MVSEFFRKEGWQVWMELGPAESDLLTTIADEWFDLIGLSIGSDAELDDLSGLIGRIREASNNPSVFVMIGGAAIYGRTDLSSNHFGADAFAADAASAVELARELLATTA
jgi:methanogenic corrinoid protein MtbC1